ncbi:MAG: peptidoglycan-binding protein [Candidatus Omnitrophica bacterium]|nr:peptidoglycan-binding protein [Candidatus Omnitrophota bacterium]
MRCVKFLIVLVLILPATGCDRIYAVLHKPGGEERQILGAFEFNEYNAKVEEVQKILKSFGYNIGHPDGKFGASTREAVAKFQEDEGLKVTRFVDKETWAGMQAVIQSPLFKKGVLDGRAVQKALLKAGFGSGKIDGQLGARSREAIKGFQSSEGLEADGQIGLDTIRALLKYVPVPASKKEM